MNRIERIAKNLVANDVFTKLTPIKFKSEGSTAYSLFNARMIKEAGYGFLKGTIRYDLIKGNWYVNVFFKRDDEVAEYLFKGFSFGYGGEGPRGLLEFGKMFGINFDPNKIMSPEYAKSLPQEGIVDLERIFG